jgi:hypothetical protein
MLIQFAGYESGTQSRIYNFDVMNPPEAARKFTVEIESDASRWGILKFQDGPSICFDRLRRELEGETPGLNTKPHLRIEERDVQEYLARQHPKKKHLGTNLSRPLP